MNVRGIRENKSNVSVSTYLPHLSQCIHDFANENRLLRLNIKIERSEKKNRYPKRRVLFYVIPEREGKLKIRSVLFLRKIKLSLCMF